MKYTREQSAALHELRVHVRLGANSIWLMFGDSIDAYPFSQASAAVDHKVRQDELIARCKELGLTKQQIKQAKAKCR